MDTSNNKVGQRPVFYLLGGQHSQVDYSQEDWLMVLDNTLGEMNPIMKYLTGFRHPREVLSREVEVGMKVLLSGQKFASLPPDFVGVRKCLILCSFSSDPRLAPLFVIPEDHSHDVLLILTESGQLFLAFAIYSVQAGKPRVYHTTSISVWKVTLDELDFCKGAGASLGGNDLCVAAKILMALYKVNQTTLLEREKRVESFRQITQLIRGRMEPFDVFRTFFRQFEQ